MCVCGYCGTSLDSGVPFCPFCGKATGFASERNDYEYEAFISYRHLPVSMKAAKRIQRDLEGFRIPKELRGDDGKDRLGRLFRDEDELPASVSLSDQIKEALSRSRYLIVLCTPETRESRWVEREVELYTSLHGRDRVLVALIEGERPTSLPDVLLYRKIKSEDGTIVDEPTEPLAADFRRTSHKSRRDETLRIVAALLSCGFDDLKKRDRTRRRKTIAAFAFVVGLVSLVFIGVFGFQQEQIRNGRASLSMEQTMNGIEDADALLAKGDRKGAIKRLLGLQRETEAAASFVPEIQESLERAVQAYPTQHSWLPLYRNYQNESIDDLEVSEAAQSYATIDDAGILRIYGLLEGDELCKLDLRKSEPDLSDSEWAQWELEPCADAYLVYARRGGVVLLVDAREGSIRWSFRVPEGVAAARAAVDGSAVCITSYADTESLTSYEGRAYVLDAKSGGCRSVAKMQVEELSNSKVALSDNGDSICATFGSNVIMCDANGNVIKVAKMSRPLAYGVSWVGDVALVIGVDEYAMGFPATIQAFLPYGDAGAVWSYDSAIGVFAHNGYGFSPIAEFYGEYDAADGAVREIVGLGSKLMLLDVNSGVVNLVKELESPISTAQIVQGREGVWARVCTVYGGVSEDALEGQILGQERSDIVLDPISIACFSIVGERDILVTAPFDDNYERRSVSVYALPTSLGARFAEPTPEAKAFVAGRSREPTESEMTTMGGLLELPEEGKLDYVSVSTDGKYAVAQKEGVVNLINLSEGRVLGMSASKYGTLAGSGFTDDDKLFYCEVPGSGQLGDKRLLVFDLEKGGGTPKSAIVYGKALSNDGTKVLVETSATAYTLPYLELEELVDRGSQILKEPIAQSEGWPSV